MPGQRGGGPTSPPCPDQEEAPGRCVGSSLLRRKSAPPAPCHAPDRACPSHCPASRPLGQAPLGFLTCAEQRATFQGGAQIVCPPPPPLIRSAFGKLVPRAGHQALLRSPQEPRGRRGKSGGEAPLPGGCPSTAPPGVGGADRLRAGGWSPGRGGGARPLPASGAASASAASVDPGPRTPDLGPRARPLFLAPTPVYAPRARPGHARPGAPAARPVSAR